MPKPHTELTLAMVELLCAEVRNGVKPTRACLAAGFHRNTWGNWCRKAEAGEEPYAEHVAAIHRAEAIFLSGLERDVAEARHADWRAGMTMLERRCREDYGPKIDVTNRTADVEDMSRDQLLAIAYGKTPDAAADEG